MTTSSLYDYNLIPELIARQPAVPRDFSRLFVYDTETDEIVFDRFYNLAKYLPSESFLVMNNTKVIPARVEMRKVSGGKVRALFLVNELNNDQFSMINFQPASPKLPAKGEVRQGRQRGESISNDQIINKNKIRAFIDRKLSIGDKLFFNSQYFVTVIDQHEHIFTVEFNFSTAELFRVLEKKGTMPIPLYIKNTPLSRDELLHKYQTIFAHNKGSAAAPTASLHFTNRLFKKLEKKGISKEFITLHVGMGTFAPVTDDQMKQKKLHEEYFEINNNTLHYIDISKSEGKKIVAVGTTVARTLEAFASSKFKDQSAKLKFKNKKERIIGKTDLFIQPGFEFKYVDALITNFHLPGSSLMMLVEAFLQYKNSKHHLVDLYKIAIKEKFRFYSFGDGMLIR